MAGPHGIRDAEGDSGQLPGGLSFDGAGLSIAHPGDPLDDSSIGIHSPLLRAHRLAGQGL